MSENSLTVIRPVAPMDIAICDHENPRSIINLVPPVVRESIRRLPEEFFTLSETELESLTPKKSFTVTDRRLRTAFWIEYGRAQDTHTMMNMSSVYGGVCSRPYFYSSVLQDKARLAYILNQPSDYKIAMEEALSYGVDKLREILEMPLYDPSGRPDSKIADIVLKTVALIDQRVKGAVVQKIHQVNQNVPTHAPKNQDATSMEEIDRKLAELESKLSGRKAELADIEITPEPIGE